MPIYEYECASCGRRFDELQRITEDALTIDPECGGSLRRVIQPVGIIFKGSGFYVTDSRNSSSSSSTKSSSETKTEANSESKPESKSESKSDSKSESSSKAESSSKSDSSSKSSDSSKSTTPAAA